MDVPKIKNPSWRAYQARLQQARKNEDRKRFIRSNLKYLLPVLVCCLVIYGFISGSFGSLFDGEKNTTAYEKAAVETEKKPAAPAVTYHKDQIHHFIDSRHFAGLQNNFFEIQNNGRDLKVQTSIDPLLQNYLTQKLDRKNSSHIGIVAMDPDDGRILTLVGYNKTDPSDNPCLDSSFPAASIFKIVTATAALEKCICQIGQPGIRQTGRPLSEKNAAGVLCRCLRI